MALADLAAYRAAVLGPPQAIYVSKSNSATNAARPFDTWTGSVFAGAAPSTAAVPARNVAGALGQENGASGALRCVGGNQQALSGGYGSCAIVIDRLSHQGGLDATVTSAQTTNLPTAALTRYTSGVGVMCGLTIYTTIGTTPTTVTVSYTNQAGTGGQVSPAVVIGGNPNTVGGRLVMIPPAAGDTGFRSVESVTLAGSTGTAGNIGVTLFKPLTMFIGGAPGEEALADLITGRMGGGLPEILDDACLSLVVMQGPSATVAWHGSLFFHED
jgi:hypothetical protein